MKKNILSTDEAKQLSSAFSKYVLKDITSNKPLSELEKIIINSSLRSEFKGKSYSFAFDYIFKLLLKSYRNEYVYKNAIAKKIVIGKHKLANAAFFSEFKCWDTITDCVVVNGTTSAYEIKTEYDSFSRLDNQLDTYQKTFELVNVVIPESKLKSLLEKAPIHIGIIVLTDSYTLSTYRKASSNLERLSSKIIFSCLRKKEYEEIIIKYFGALPNEKPALVRRACSNLFLQLDNYAIHKEFVNSLKRRQLDDTTKTAVKLFPQSLASLSMTLGITTKNLEYLATKLTEPIKI